MPPGTNTENMQQDNNQIICAQCGKDPNAPGFSCTAIVCPLDFLAADPVSVRTTATKNNPTDDRGEWVTDWPDNIPDGEPPWDNPPTS